MAIGVKKNETRSWPTSYRGELAICSSKHVWKTEVPDGAVPALRVLWEHRTDFPFYAGNVKDLYDALPRGRVVAVVRLDDCVGTVHGFSDLEKALGDYTYGRAVWRTTQLRRLKEPVPVVGRQGLFDLPPEVEAAVRRQL